MQIELQQHVSEDRSLLSSDAKKMCYYNMDSSQSGGKLKVQAKLRKMGENQPMEKQKTKNLIRKQVT